MHKLPWDGILQYCTVLKSVSLLAAQDLVEEGILVSPRMMADHMPDYLTAVLRRVAHARASSRHGSPVSDGDPSRSTGTS